MNGHERARESRDSASMYEEEETMSTRPPLARSRDDRILAGVAGGLGRYFAVDPLLVRIAFVLLALVGGGGLLLYIVLAVIMRPDDDPSLQPGDTVRRGVEDLADGVRSGVENVRGGGNRGRRTLGVVLLVLGILALMRNAGAFAWLGSGWAWALLLIALGVWLLMRTRGAR